MIDMIFVSGSCSGCFYGFCETGEEWKLSVRHLSQTHKEHCCKSVPSDLCADLFNRMTFANHVRLFLSGSFCISH
jgi:hypothetical protein